MLFIVSGFEKIISPHQNFLYVIQGYDFVKSPFDQWVAIAFPWMEFLIGVFIFLGLWLKMALRGAGLLFLSFMIVVGKALIRKLPLDECGCFGELISIPPVVVFTMDSLSLIVSVWLIKRLDKTSFFSLDKYYSQS